ncbi:MAG: fumarylacetoacetate hydrolase family protein [Ignavibacteria bacterium]|nr:MAG: fumarylacetoacetate hydrolase family protein [Ignavibacteria bacterium]
MRLCTFEVKTPLGKQSRLGIVFDEKSIIDLNSACAWHLQRKGEPQPYRLANALVPPTLIEYLRGGATSVTFANATIEHLTQELKTGTSPTGLNGESIVFRTPDVRLMAPLPRPASMRDFYSFEEHVKKGFEKRGEPMPAEWYEMPVYYKGNHQSIIGPDEDVHWPSFTQQFDYELELAIIIGKAGRNIPEARAREHIAGFTIMNDFSARDMQKKEMKVRLGPAKGKDFATAIGPVLVTPDEIGDPYTLKMTARINGEVWSEGNSRAMYHSFEKMIAFVSMDETIEPGDLFGSGTVGKGCGLELDRWLKPGDIVELEIEGIGILKNRVVKP